MAQSRPRVGIFQAEWPLQTQTYNCAFVLSQAGFAVDLFLYDAPTFCDLDAVRRIPNTTLQVISKADPWLERADRFLTSLGTSLGSWPGLRALLIRVHSALHRLGLRPGEFFWRPDSRKILLSDWLLRRTRSLMEDNDYQCLIGVEKKGLIWAGKIAEQMNIPYMYYSLELYTWDHPMNGRSPRNRRVKLAEEKYHRKTVATIVQDAERAEVLLRDNGVRSGDVFFVPTSLLGEPCRSRSTFLQERLGIGADRPVILQFGQICVERCNLELARVAQNFPRDWALVLHGWGPRSALKAIRRIDKAERVHLSVDTVPAADIPKLISSAHLGLAFYSPSPLNDRLTALSSEKVALYLSCGVPIIAFDYEGYRKLVDRYHCGVTIASTDELPTAVERMLASYERYRAGAYDCFSECFRFDRHFEKVIERIRSL